MMAPTRRDVSESLQELARRATDLFGTKPKLSRPGVAKPIRMRGVLNHVCFDAYSWHPDYQLPESAEYQFRYNESKTPLICVL